MMVDEYSEDRKCKGMRLNIEIDVVIHGRIGLVTSYTLIFTVSLVNLFLRLARTRERTKVQGVEVTFSYPPFLPSFIQSS